MNTSSRAIIGLDFVRFASAFMVMLMHLSVYWWLPGISTPYGAHYHAAFHPIFELFRWGGVGVPIFFVLSGFVIAFTANNRRPMQFFQSRVLRLYPAAWLCATLSLILGRWGESGAFGDYLRAMVLSPAGPWISVVYWTLAVEVFFYILVGLSLYCKIRMSHVGALLGIVSAAYWIAKLADFVTGGHFKDVFAVPDTSKGPLYLISVGAYFSIGILLWSVHFEDKSRWKYSVIAASYVAVAISLTSGARNAMSIHGGPKWEILVPLMMFSAGLIAIVASVRWNDALWRRGPTFASTARTIGLITYPLYLLHAEIGRESMVWLSGLNPYLALAITVTAMVALSRVVVAIEPAVRKVIRRLFNLKPADASAITRPG